ncbi:hypothetical protein [Streptomyces sp. ODS28]|uniref:hypothetical protein n=1 Tax=Streptomyces sp. ODS28 TaxID=3136688 RepID=UPI0031F00C34
MENTALHGAEHDSLEQLLGDCALMTPHWRVTDSAAELPAVPARPEELHGVRVPARSARLLDGMSEYGD